MAGIANPRLVFLKTFGVMFRLELLVRFWALLLGRQVYYRIMSSRFVSDEDSSYSFQFNETARPKGRDQNVSRRNRGSLATDRVSGGIEPVAQESVVDSALLRSIFRPFKPAFLYTSCTQIFGMNPYP